jgi:hypothetical protein
MPCPKFQLPLIKTTRLILCLALLAVGAAGSFAQQVIQTNKSLPLTIPAREALARPLLLHAEAAGVSDATAHALLLYRAAGAWLALDASRATRLYGNAFAVGRGSSATVRQPLEEAILNELLLLSPSDVLELLPRAERSTQNHLYAGVIKYWLFQGDYPKAVGAFDSATANGIFPEEATVHLLATLPTGSSAERTRVFSEAIGYCQRHPDREEPWGPPHAALARLVARFYAQMPPALVLQAIHTVLLQAEQHDWQHPGGGISAGSGENYIELHSDYGVQLFVVAPALQELDGAQAAALLAQYPEVADNLKRYPKGWPSFAVNDFSLNYAISPNHEKPMDLRLWSNSEDILNLDPHDLGLEFTVPRTMLPGFAAGGGLYLSDPKGPEVSVLEQLKAHPSDFAQHLELARTVPIVRKVAEACSGPVVTTNVAKTEAGVSPWCSYRDEFPRAALIEYLAEGYKNLGNPAAARAALREQMDLLQQMPEEGRVDYIALAADLYLRLGDQDAAASVTQEGFRLARAIYEREMTSKNLDKFPKGFWSSAQIYQRMITLGVNASLEETRKAVDEIPDANLRELENVMLARALLGVPVRRYIIEFENGALLTAGGTTYEHTFR